MSANGRWLVVGDSVGVCGARGTQIPFRVDRTSPLHQINSLSSNAHDVRSPHALSALMASCSSRCSCPRILYLSRAHFSIR